MREMASGSIDTPSAVFAAECMYLQGYQNCCLTVSYVRDYPSVQPMHMHGLSGAGRSLWDPKRRRKSDPGLKVEG